MRSSARSPRKPRERYRAPRRSGGNLRLSGWDLVATACSGRRLGMPFVGRAARVEVERALVLVGADKLARRPLAEISGGERQRLPLGQALIGRLQLLG
jgi:zinc/manganese transport system ATP-binding protein